MEEITMEEFKKNLPSSEDSNMKIYVPQGKAIPVRQQTSFLDHAPVRIYERPRRTTPFPPAVQ